MLPPLAYCHHMSYQLQTYRRCSQHIADTLPPTLHLPISPEDTLHFYRYLHTPVLIENKQFLLLIDIPIQDRACQITIHEVFTLDIPHGNYSAHYDIKTRYFGVDQRCHNGIGTIYCTISDMSTSKWTVLPHIYTCPTPSWSITCIAALYAKSKASITSKCSLQLCKTTTTVLPTQITPDVWILTTPVTAPVNTIISDMPRQTTWKQLLFNNHYMYWNYLWPAVPLQLISTYPLGMKPQSWMSMYHSIWQISKQ